MALSALKAKLKGPSSSFKDKCGRLNPTLTEVYPDLGWNFTIMKDEEHWSKNGCSIKTGPSGREDENVFKQDESNGCNLGYNEISATPFWECNNYENVRFFLD